MLVKFVREKKETWESYLDTCIYAYNTSRHETSLFTPFELMFGRKSIIPVDLDNGSEHAQPMGQTLSFPETEAPFVQMLHVGENHWTMVPSGIRPNHHPGV